MQAEQVNQPVRLTVGQQLASKVIDWSITFEHHNNLKDEKLDLQITQTPDHQLASKTVNNIPIKVMK